VQTYRAIFDLGDIFIAPRIICSERGKTKERGLRPSRGALPLWVIEMVFVRVSPFHKGR